MPKNGHLAISLYLNLFLVLGQILIYNPQYMKPDFYQRTFFVLSVFASILAILVMPLVYKKQAVLLIIPIVLLTIFSFVLYKIAPGDKK